MIKVKFYERKISENCNFIEEIFFDKNKCYFMLSSLSGVFAAGAPSQLVFI